MTITIGVLSPVTGGFYYGKVLEGITREVAAAGGRVVLLQTLDAGISSDEVVDAPDFDTPTAWDHVDGVVSIATGTQRGHLDRLRAAGKPVALASDQIDGLPVPAVVPDNGGGIVAAVNHLVAHGHTRIGFAGNLVQSDMRARFAGYRDALVANGIDPDPRWCFEPFDNGELGGADVARLLVAAGLPVTALVTATDRNAVGCLAELATLGVDVPGTVAVTGFDGIEAGAYTEPTLSTVCQRSDELGAAAVRLVLAQLRDEEVAVGVHVVPAEFVARRSCGCDETAAVLDVSGAPDLEFWQSEARVHLARSKRRERWMREQYEIGIQLLDFEHADPCRLEWLASTDVRGAHLALWEGQPSDHRVTIVGAYDPSGALADLVGSTRSVREFPPAELLDLADAAANEVTIVVPVKARGRDFGLLAVVGEVDTLSANGRETHNEWAALLTSALEQQLLQRELRTSEERYSLWAVATDDGLWDWDLASNQLFYSGRCMEMLGHEYRSVTAGPDLWLDVVHPDDLDRMRTAMDASATRIRTAVELEHRIRGRDGTYRRVLLRALPVGDPGRPAERIVGSLHDIEHRKQLEERLRRGALYDEVTGLPNRKLFLERLGTALERAERDPQRTFAVVFLDLDGFKLVNDSLGHLAGDRLLATAGERLCRRLRGNDLAARFGGDEFAVLLHGVQASDLGSIVERMQCSLAEPMDLDGHEVAVSASAGITTSAVGYTSAEDVLRDADIAMYEAKTRQRGSFALFDVDMHAGALSRIGLQSELRQALDRGQFEVHYQPIVDLVGDRADRFEALVRWRHPERGLVLPGEFLAVMEETGLVAALDRWVADEVCRQIACWQRDRDASDRDASDRDAVNVSLNVSDRGFRDPELVPHLLAVLARHGLGPERLTLEVSETVIMRAADEAHDIITRLDAAGIGVHIDDFGTGTSSLHALHRFPVRALKIDRTFIRDLHRDPRTAALVKIIVAGGDALGLDVVAEGVETAEQLALLRQLGCRDAQGYWFSVPVDGAAAGRLVGASLPRLDHTQLLLAP